MYLQNSIKKIVLILVFVGAMSFLPSSVFAVNCDSALVILGQNQRINISELLSISGNINTRIKSLTSCPAAGSLSCNDAGELLCGDGSVAALKTTGAKVVVGTFDELKGNFTSIGANIPDISKFTCNTKQASIVGAGVVGSLNFSVQCCSGASVNGCTSLEQGIQETVVSEAEKEIAKLCVDSCKNNKDATKLKCGKSPNGTVLKCCPGGTPACLPVGTAGRLVKDFTNPDYIKKLTAGDPTVITDLGKSAGELAYAVRCGKTNEGSSLWSTIGGVLGGILGAFIGPVGASAGAAIGSGLGSLAHGLFASC
jgi:hypothetical protein